MFHRIEPQSDHPSTPARPPEYLKVTPCPYYRKHGENFARRQAIGLLLSLLFLAGCSGKTLDKDLPTIAPARAAQSPPLSQAPAGVVRPLAGAPQTAIFDGHTSQLVIVAPGPTSTSPSSLTLLGFAANISAGR